MSNISRIIDITKDADLKVVAEKIATGTRISFDDGVLLFEKGSLSFLGALANFVLIQNCMQSVMKAGN